MHVSIYIYIFIYLFIYGAKAARALHKTAEIYGHAAGVALKGAPLPKGGGRQEAGQARAASEEARERRISRCADASGPTPDPACQRPPGAREGAAGAQGPSQPPSSGSAPSRSTPRGTPRGATPHREGAASPDSAASMYCIHTCMHTCMHTYIYAYIHTCIHTCIIASL